MAEVDLSRTHEDLTQELTNSFTESARVLFSAGAVADTLQRVVELAVDTIDGCDFAGIFLLDDGALTTPAHTDPTVTEVDALQHRYGHAMPGGSQSLVDRDDRGPHAQVVGPRELVALRPTPAVEPSGLRGGCPAGSRGA